MRTVEYPKGALLNILQKKEFRFPFFTLLPMAPQKLNQAFARIDFFPKKSS
jgi:hypothetical protein